MIRKVKSPLHIGSGRVCGKKEYLFNPNSNTVQMLDMDAFLSLILRRSLADRYEAFVFSGNSNLYKFLRDNGISEEIASVCRYRVSAADALDDSHSLKEIHTFVRNGENNVYIPGSSIKGALRTVLLSQMMQREKKGVWPDDKRKAQNARQMATLEGEYLNTLSLKERNGASANDAVNSIMRGIQISDSLPVQDEAVILVGKNDANPEGDAKKLPLCRECLRPGTVIRTRLTLDQSVLHGKISAESIMQAIAEFHDYYQRTYASRFDLPDHAAIVGGKNCLILGGGSGFFAKTVTYPYLGEKEGLTYTASSMTEQFRKHGHEKDITRHGISPHTMKYGLYKGMLYPYGVCEVKIE